MVKMPRNCRLSRMIDTISLFLASPLGVCISYQPQEVTRSSVEEITVNIRFLLGTNRFVCYMHFLHLVKEISLSQGIAGPRPRFHSSHNPHRHWEKKKEYM